VVVVLAAEFLLQTGSAMDGSGLEYSAYLYVDVVAHGDKVGRGYQSCLVVRAMRLLKET